MPTDTALNNLIINKMTYQQAIDNVDSLNEKELIFTSDKILPVPVAADNGKILQIESGEYALVNYAPGTTYTTTISATASNYIFANNVYTMTKTLTGLKSYDALLLEINDTFTNTCGGLITVTDNLITINLTTLPSSDFSITYSIIKCVNGGIL